MAASKSIRDAVRSRAKDRCEYCLLPAAVTPERFHIEHVIARKHGGETALHNLALSCSRCNFYKGPNLSGIDSLTGTIGNLFHPRCDRWHDHFERRGPTIQGKTARGRITVAVLNINDADRVELRSLLVEEGAIPEIETELP